MYMQIERQKLQLSTEVFLVRRWGRQKHSSNWTTCRPQDLSAGQFGVCKIFWSRVTHPLRESKA